MLPFPEDRQPAQSGLGSLQDQHFEQSPVVVHRYAPLVVVVGDIQGVPAAPFTAGHRNPSFSPTFGFFPPMRSLLKLLLWISEPYDLAI